MMHLRIPVLFLLIAGVSLPGPAWSFTPEFKFCVATAAHQIEGGNLDSDWDRWEQTPGKIKNGDHARIATDSWNHVEEDVQHMKDLGVDLYRFSVEWAKIEPSPGVFRAAEVERYRDLVRRLRAEGIDSMVTLHHFTLPAWVADRGGWDWSGIADAFERYVAFVAGILGPDVRLWITINEPMTVIAGGYVSDVFPPGRGNISLIAGPITNMVRAHARAYHRLHRILDTRDFRPKVGIAHHLRNFDPGRRGNPLDRYLARKFDEVFNWAIPLATVDGRLRWKVPFLTRSDVFIPEAVGTQDFFGLNYYSRDRLRFRPFKAPFIHRETLRGADTTELGWEVYPVGMDRLLIKIRMMFPGMEIYLTENGLADQDDNQRIPFIREHLKVLEKHIRDGAPIRGYCHWTLNDNFEWAEGYTAHFGFYSLEPGTLKRIPRPSAIWFGEMTRKVKETGRLGE